jgi:two-component system, NtrC family, sensor histidine kinase GlrK
MRLFPRILISHAIPSLVLALALALTVLALVRLTVMLGKLNDQELGALETDATLHRAGWAVDVAMRHGRELCAGDATQTQSGRVRAVIEGDLGALRVALSRNSDASPDLRRAVLRYVALGERVLATDVCESLKSASIEQQRAHLDEELTNRWVDRLAELSRALQQKDAEARSLGKLASWIGGALAVIAFVFASTLARRLARDLSQPLGELSALTRRIGRGDFYGRVEVVGPAEVTALAEDLERMRARLAEIESLKQGFLASISHELRTPLTKIREALSLLSDGVTGPLADRQARVVEIARTACEREIRMVSTLLDLSRLRAGTPLRMREAVSFDTVLCAALDDEAEDAVSRGVTVDMELHGEAPLAELDAELLERAIANLVRNAVGVSKSGDHVRVTRDILDRGPNDREGSWARVSVEDHGPGVPDDLRDTIFEAFVTRAVPRSPKTVGIGLGLALAREVARAHGGDLVLGENGPGGATFELWVPVGEPTPKSTPKDPRSPMERPA